MSRPSSSSTAAKPPLTVLLAEPRGFCAGVDRAIAIVEKALTKFGPPVYVRHEIVHNKHVLESLRAKGAVFVAELDDIPTADLDRGCPVVFSAHGVPKSVPARAEAMNITYIDATCPLVSKVHREAERHHKQGHHILLIGHAGHPEVVGTMGQLPPDAVTLIETTADVAALDLPRETPLAYVTQTTLSVDDTTEIVAALQNRYPAITAPHKEDICYATTNRQLAVRDIAAESDAVVVIGSRNSSNSNRLVEVARAYGARVAVLADTAAEIDWDNLIAACGGHLRALGLTAGASAPETLVQDVLTAASTRFDVTLKRYKVAEETVVFKLPGILRAAE